MHRVVVLLFALGLVFLGCHAEEPAPSPEQEPTPTTTAKEVKGMILTSTAFEEGKSIPVRYACDGDDLSPDLSWTAGPKGTAGYVLICEDPDAPVGMWIHWVLYDIPPATTGLAEAISPDEKLADGSLHGRNSWGKFGYGGPCPPGGTHRYFFKLYALDTLLEKEAGLTRSQVLKLMEGHVLAETHLMGTYSRK